jgi:hypothetical protein
MLDVELFLQPQPVPQPAHPLLYTGGSVISWAIACACQGTRCMTRSLIHLVVHWPRRLVAGLLPRRPELDLRSVHVRFVIERHCDGFYSEYFGLTLSVSLPSMSCAYLHPHVASTRRTDRRSMGTFRKTMLSLKLINSLIYFTFH